MVIMSHHIFSMRHCEFISCKICANYKFCVFHKSLQKRIKEEQKIPDLTFRSIRFTWLEKYIFISQIIFSKFFNLLCLKGTLMNLKEKNILNYIHNYVTECQIEQTKKIIQLSTSSPHNSPKKSNQIHKLYSFLLNLEQEYKSCNWHFINSNMLVESMMFQVKSTMLQISKDK